MRSIFGEGVKKLVSRRVRDGQGNTMDNGNCDNYVLVQYGYVEMFKNAIETKSCNDRIRLCLLAAYINSVRATRCIKN